MMIWGFIAFIVVMIILITFWHFPPTGLVPVEDRWWKTKNFSWKLDSR